MDEKLKRDSSQVWTELDSTQTNTKASSTKTSGTDWIKGTGIVLGVTLILFVLFNLRSK
jgi:hypothetical protein